MNHLSKSEVKTLLLADMDKKTRNEFYRDGMKCLNCGDPQNCGDALFIIGGYKCCQKCKDAIVNTIKENL